MLSLAFPGSPLAGAYPLSRGYSCATIASRLRLRTLPYVVNRITHPRHAVEGSKITIESVSKAYERLWFRLHTAPWFKPFRSAGVLLLGKTTKGLSAIVSRSEEPTAELQSLMRTSYSVSGWKIQSNNI